MLAQKSRHFLSARNATAKAPPSVTASGKFLTVDRSIVIRSDVCPQQLRNRRYQYRCKLLSKGRSSWHSGIGAKRDSGDNSAQRSPSRGRRRSPRIL